MHRPSPYENRNRRSAPHFRLLSQLPFEVTSPRFGRCRLEFRPANDRRNCAVFLVELEHKREWMVHSFHVTNNPIGENALYTYSVEIDGAWQLRLFDQLVRDGRAQRVDLD